ncbi:MAG: hypothetical protein ACR2PT_09725 [Endozoicomonas sp.]
MNATGQSQQSGLPQTQPEGRKGVFNAGRIRFISFVVISTGLFTTAFLSILTIWGYAAEDTAWRAVATLAVVTITMVAFTVINEVFGAKIEPRAPDPE